MVNFGPLAAEIGSLVYGTPANFNGFRVLAALLHETLVVGVSQILRRWTEGAIYIRQGGHDVGHWPTFYYWAQKLIFILLSHGGWKAVLTYTLAAQSVPEAVYHSGCRDKHNCPGCRGEILEIRTSVASYRSQGDGIQ